MSEVFDRLRRFFGFVLLLTGVGGILLAFQAARFSHTLIDDLAADVDGTLDLVSDNLDLAATSLAQARTTITSANTTLTTVTEVTIDVSTTVSDTRPLLTQTRPVIAESIPNSLDAVQAAIPDLVQVANVIDNALTALARFNFERDFLGTTISFGLGVDYDPEVPFDVSVQVIGDSLEGIPEELRGTGAHLDAADGNLAQISSDLDRLAADIEVLNEDVAGFLPVLTDYQQMVTTAQDDLRQTRARLDERWRRLKWGASLLFTWLGLTQLAAVYLGLDILLGGRGAKAGAA